MNKLTSRKYVSTTSTAALVVANEAMGLGFSPAMMWGVLGLAAVYALCEAWVDTTRIRTAALQSKLSKS